jgi:hypothetical protein
MAEGVYASNGQYIPVFKNKKFTNRGYDDERFTENQGSTWSGSGDSAYNNNDGLRFTAAEDGSGDYVGSDGHRYLRNQETTGTGDSGQTNTWYQRYNTAKDTIHDGADIAGGPDSHLWGSVGKNKNNFELTPSDVAPPAGTNWYTGQLKTADKEADQIRWTLKGDEWVPEVLGRKHWDTNPDNTKLIIALAVVATMGAAAYAAPALAAAEGVAAGTAGTGAVGTAGSSALIADAGAVIGASEAAGSLFPAATGISAGTGSVGTGIGVGGVGVGGGSASLWDQGVNYVKDYVTDPKNIIKNGMDLVGQGGAPQEQTITQEALAGQSNATPGNYGGLDGINFNKIGDPNGGRKPGAFAVPEAPQAPSAPGIAGQQFNQG